MRKYDYSQEVIYSDAVNDPDSSAMNELEASETVGLVIPRRYDIINFEEGTDNLDVMFEGFDYQLTYKFSSKLRKYKFGNSTYGSPNMTIRRLFEILCSMNGKNFVDDYLENVLPYSAVGQDLREYIEQLKEDAKAEFREKIKITKSGKVARWGWNIKRLSDLKSLIKSGVNDEAKILAKKIKEDIIMSLRTGQVPLTTHTLSPATQRKRIRLGLDKPLVRFYASGQVIEGIQFYLRLERKGKWEMTGDIAV